MVRMACSRDCDAICEIEGIKERERKKERKILESDVMEEGEVILWNVLLSDQTGCCGCFLGATEYFPLLKGTSRNRRD